MPYAGATFGQELIESLMKWTEPSANAAFSPPGCMLDAASLGGRHSASRVAYRRGLGAYWANDQRAVGNIPDDIDVILFVSLRLWNPPDGPLAEEHGVARAVGDCGERGDAPSCR